MTTKRRLGCSLIGALLCACTNSAPPPAAEPGLTEASAAAPEPSGNGLRKGTPGAHNGDADYCNFGAAAGPSCVAKEGDCDSNGECTGGTICVTDNGGRFNMNQQYEVCVAPHCNDHILNGGEAEIDCGGPDCGS